MIGNCLCKKIQFEIDGALPRLYQCHCSQCRKQSGATANTATVVNAEKFRWLAGQRNISTWRHDSGFRSHFCTTCGCPVPNPLGNLPYIWIPVGLLDKTGHKDVFAHIFVGSKADWENTPTSGLVYDTVPELSEFIAMLQQPVTP
ncbi:MAG: GFA family protein [Gammaproteobacteria bacterium]|nr:GFA family protein [Gammaproteobacteria bacterium]